MTASSALRPIERRISQMAREGMDEVEIAWRFRRTPRFVRQVIELSTHPGRTLRPDDGETLRPIERRVLRWRDDGHDFESLAPRFRRSPRFLEQVETLARYKLGDR